MCKLAVQPDGKVLVGGWFTSMGGEECNYIARLHPDGIRQLNRYHTVELIKQLQESEKVSRDAMIQIEWNFLPWLDEFSSDPVTLEKQLTSNPVFFAELVAIVFRSKKENDEAAKEVGEQKQNLVRNGYKLLKVWKRCPGTREDGTLDAGAFNEWVNEVCRLTEETGHEEVAQRQIGHVLIYAPADPGGLWIHEAVATVLNFKKTGNMRTGFKTELSNQREDHGFTYGKEEREPAKQYREKADSLDARGFARVATVMRELAEEYNYEAERKEKLNPFEDLEGI